MQESHTQPTAGRFVILRHEGSGGYKPGVHWDLMLEFGPSLRTWAMAESPQADRKIAAERLADHRLAYLDYEGPISGDRGAVSRFDAGEFQTVSDLPDELMVVLNGRELHGRLTLLRRDNGTEWQCTFEPDAPLQSRR
jgi:hypothetical protein